MTPNRLPPEDRKFYKGKALDYGETSMALAVANAGGFPWMAYTGDSSGAWAREVMSRADGLLLSGGADVDPSTYGEALRDPAWRGQDERDAFELALYRQAVADGKPVLGVCRGAQLINVAEGGTLWQDIASMREASLTHRSQERYDGLGHGVSVAPGTWLSSLFGDEAHETNSIHHQGVKDLAPSLTPLAWAPDKLVEAFERQGDGFVVGVQWHPEWMQERRSQQGLFERFVDACRSPS